MLDCVVKEAVRCNLSISFLSIETILADHIDYLNIVAGGSLCLTIFILQQDLEVWGQVLRCPALNVGPVWITKY